MTRTRLAIAGAVALAAGLVIAPSPVSAEQDDGGGPSVEVSTSGSYIVVMEADPLIATFDVEELDSAPAQAEAAEIVESHEEALEAVGADASVKVQDYKNALNGFSAVISHDEALALAAQKSVKLVMPDELRQLQHNRGNEGDFLGLTGPGEAWDAGLRGEGVVVGVIDSGIWPEHPSFADDGSYPAPPIPPLSELEFPACDFGNTAHNPNDAPFECNNKLIGARQTMPTYRLLIGADPDEFDSARDDDGHGTHTASTAAGNEDVEAFLYGEHVGHVSGVAPRAHVIAYKGLGNLGGFGSDLAASIDQAVADGVDVINYSVGGGASLAGADDIAFLFAADAGVFVATSAGNSGPGEGTIGGPASVPWLTSVGASTQHDFYEGHAHLRRGGQVKGASITPGTDGRLPLVDAEFAGGDLCVPGTLDPAVVEGKIVLCRRGAIARVAKSLAVYQAGGAGMILYNNDNVGDLVTDTHWVPSIHTDLKEGLKVKDYIATNPNPKAAIHTGDVRDKRAPNMAKFSSRGPNPVAEDLIKPDVTAPGVQILAGNSPFPDPGSVPGELFQAIQGTSMSSPHVAGLFALIKQWNPDWTPAMAKSAIMTTAFQQVRDNDRTSRADPFDMGAGHIDPGKPYEHGSAFDPGLVYDAGLFEYAAFTCGADLGVFTPGSCVFLDSIGVPSDASDLNLPSIGIAELAGSQTVTRTVTSVAHERVRWRARVDAPAGYTVTVNPSTMVLDPGESASFQVTITNDGSGAVGEWNFGSLTWRSRDYKARSPIAVRGALFDAPPAVTGTGTAGSGSFDVGFGYTGPYTAAPHGLEAAVITADTVVQDPDQNFDPADGFSNAHTFDLSGAAYFRIAMGPEDVIDPAVDLDIFVYDPSGTQVAQSTLGGTDELVDILLPADGTWTVYVHGWQTAGPSTPYEMSTWSFSATPGGGSLSVDGAPASATIGTSGTVDYSWSGLTPDTEYLGAVSHSDAGGIIGLTLVEVDAGPGGP